jgi:hypothetical protein
MQQINIRINRDTHRRLRLLRELLGIQTNSTPTLDDVIEAGLNHLEPTLDTVVDTRSVAALEAPHASA